MNVINYGNGCPGTSLFFDKSKNGQKWVTMSKPATVPFVHWNINGVTLEETVVDVIRSF